MLWVNDSAITVFAGRHTRIRLEKLVEDTLVREIQVVHDFLDRSVRIAEHVLRLEDDEGVYPVRG